VKAPEPTAHHADQVGQTLPLVVLMMFVVIGMAGVVIDLGNGYLQQRSTQNVADATALAGAAGIPTGTWSSIASQYAASNDIPGDRVTSSFNGKDAVTVSVSRTVPTYFLGLFGKSSITVTSTATATVEALTQIKGHVAPYAVTTQAYANGSGTTLFVENAPGAYGTIDLPATDNTSGGSCSGNTNLGTPPNVKAELSDQLPAGELAVGGCLSVKSGASQPSATVVNSLPHLNDDMADDLKPIGGNTYQVIPQAWDDAQGLPPRLLYVPIVNQLPSGNGQAIIQQFAWFYVTSATGSGNKLTINGQWVSMALPDSGTTTTYIPGLKGQILTVELTA
jgi:Flp pilus assembly protein TadG